MTARSFAHPPPLSAHRQSACIPNIAPPFLHDRQRRVHNGRRRAPSTAVPHSGHRSGVARTSYPQVTQRRRLNRLRRRANRMPPPIDRTIGISPMTIRQSHRGAPRWRTCAGSAKPPIFPGPIRCHCARQYSSPKRPDFADSSFSCCSRFCEDSAPSSA
jgi:hypothetical protein